MQRATENELRSFFMYVIETLEHLGIPYMVVGGFAAILYGEPRLTIDIDIVVDMKPADVSPFVERFPIPDYYASEEAIRDSLQRRYPFNVIQPSTGAKVDLIPLPDDLFTRLAFQRRQRLELDESGRSAYVIAPEDIVIAKLIAYRETGSDKHLRDARGILLIQGEALNVAAVRDLADRLGIRNLLEQLIETLPGNNEEVSE